MRIRLGFGLFALLVVFAATAAAGPVKTPDCGGHTQRPCTPVDTEFYFNSGSGFGCDRGLKIDLNNFFKTSDDQCVNDTRQTGGKEYSWATWALAQQRYNIAAGEPINWVTSLNAHNAYNNRSDNYSIPDQKYSMTDLLNWGVRSLELDVHWAYGQVLLCHALNNHFGCASFDRLYAYAIREIGEWLDENPGEIVHIDFEDRATDAPDDAINAPIKKYLSGKLWFPVSGAGAPYGNVPGTTTQSLWPTMRQMAAAGRQVIITSDNTHGAKYIFPSKEHGINDDATTANIPGCAGKNNHLWYQHYTDPRSSADAYDWSRIYEGRALGDSGALLYESDVAAATRCGVGIISLGWLNGLGDAAIGYNRSGPDGRRDAMIWSWADGEDDKRGNFAMYRGSDGRWLARPNNINEKHQFACFIKRDEDPLQPGVFLDPTTYADPAGTKWYITKASDVFQNGNNICRSETNGQYVFGAPRNAKMLDFLMLAYPLSHPDLWLNYQIKPIPLPSVMPSPVNFNAAAGSTIPPPPRTVHIYSNVGDIYNITVATNLSDGAWVQVSPPSGAIGLHGADFTVSVDPVAISKLKTGPYTASLAVRDVTLNRTTVVAVSLHIKIPTQISITKIFPSTIVQSGDAQITAKLSYVPRPDIDSGGTTLATGSIILRELVTTPQEENPLDPLTGLPGPTVIINTVTAVDVGSAIVNSTADEFGQSPATNTVVFTIKNPSPGTHTYGAFYVGAYDGDSGYTGDSSYAPSSSAPASFKVIYNTSTRMFVTPPQSRLGDRVTISATVTPQSGGGPSIGGSLDFQYLADTGKVTDLGTYPIKNGLAVFDYFKLPEGRGTIYTLYSGDPNYVANKSDSIVHTTVHGNPVLVGIRIFPQGGTVLVDGTPFQSGEILTWQVNDNHQLSVPLATDPVGGARYGFRGWSDGLPATHVVAVPSSTVEYVATFAKEFLLTLNKPANGAISVQPASASGFYSAGTTVSVSASANSGYVFSNFTGDLTGSVQPQNLLIDRPRSVGALVSPIPAQVPQLIASIITKTGDANARVWTIQLNNAGPGISGDTRLTSLDIKQVFGTACTTPPAIKTQLPASVGSIAAGASAQVPVTIDFSACPALARFSVDVHSTANNSAYAGLTTINNQYR